MEAVEGQPCGYVCPVCPVQAPVDALPAPEDVTAGNCAGVEAQLAAVDEARAGLTDEEARRLDVSRYQAVVSALSALDGQAGADTPTLLADNVPYLDAGGNTETCAAATEVTSGNTSWSAGWYVVSGDVTISDPIAIAGDGDVHLILANGCTLNAEKGIVMSNVNLSIYAQSDGQDMGKLTASNDSGPKSIAIGPPIGGKGSGHITICGGHITATAVGEGSCGILIGDLDIYNGTIAATGNQYGIYGLRDYVSIRNGTVEATATAETGHGTQACFEPREKRRKNA